MPPTLGSGILPVEARERINSASAALVGERGASALTHRQVDARAGLPIGSTSNYFRTKAALLKGAIEGVITRESPLLEVVRSVDTRDELQAGLLGYVRAVTGEEMQAVKAARIALFLEGRHDPELRAWVAEARRGYAVVLSEALERLGANAPDAGATALMAVVEGSIVAITCTPAEDPSPGISVVLDGIFRQSGD